METRDEGLRAEIREMCRVDQELLHNKWMKNGDDQELASQIMEVTQKNTARMHQIVDAHGWPGKTLVGEDGANAAWLLVQHADEDREFQKRCLELMAAAGPEEVSQGNLAYWWIAFGWVRASPRCTARSSGRTRAVGSGRAPSRTRHWWTSGVPAWAWVRWPNTKRR